MDLQRCNENEELPRKVFQLLDIEIEPVGFCADTIFFTLNIRYEWVQKSKENEENAG